MQVRFLGLEDPLEEETATHSRKSHGKRSLVGYRVAELDSTEQLSMHAIIWR